MFKEYQDYKKKLSYYHRMINLMSWDLRAKAPENSRENKYEAIEFFGNEIFKLETDPKFGELLYKLNDSSDDLNDAQKLSINRDLKGYERFINVPGTFEAQYNTMQAKCEATWARAKAENDYASFAPALAKNIEMTKERMGYIFPGKDTYDALLDLWDYGLKTEDLDRIFKGVKDGIAPFIDDIKGKEVKKTKCDELTASPETMEKVQNFLLDYIGFDFKRGTTGDSPHALSSVIDPHDVRITNRLYGRHPLEVCLSAIHEGGHALYQQNVDPSYIGLAPNDLIYSDIHESMSRFMENTLARNVEFWLPVYDDLCNIWPEFKGVEPDDLNRFLNRWACSEVRTEADEMTYCMHIILRYEIELMMFRGNVSVNELSDIFSDKMKQYLGVTPKDQAHGILQDMHWSSVFYGYFPSYLLGSIYDGMYLEKMTDDLGDVKKLLLNKEMPKINNWLNKNIRSHGSLYDAPTLIKNLTGKEVSSDAMIRYFASKRGMQI